MPRSPFDMDGSRWSQASGAPSEPCLGASLRFLIVDLMTPIGRKEKLSFCLAFMFILMMLARLAPYREKADLTTVPTARCLLTRGESLTHRLSICSKKALQSRTKSDSLSCT